MNENEIESKIQMLELAKEIIESKIIYSCKAKYEAEERFEIDNSDVKKFIYIKSKIKILSEQRKEVMDKLKKM